MDRLQNTDLSATPPSATSGTTGYPRVSVPGGVAASAMHPYYLHMIIEEMRAVLVAGGITPAYTTHTQLNSAIAALIAASNPDASTTTKGHVELATSAETITGTDAVRATTPAGVAAALSASVAGAIKTSHSLTGSGNFTVPAGVTKIMVEMCGPGADGGNAVIGNGEGGGGGGGAWLRATLTVTPAEVIPYVVGTNAALADTVFGPIPSSSTTLTAGKGAIGANANLASGGAGGAGGAATGGDDSIAGQAGTDGADEDGVPQKKQRGDGGNSFVGHGGRCLGRAAYGYGAGGAGGVDITGFTTGQTGTDGMIRVWY